MPSKYEVLLYLDILAYFPEFSHRAYETVGAFVSEYLAAPRCKRPTTMFNGFCRDEHSGVYDFMRMVSRTDRIAKLPIIYSSVGSEEFSSVCIADDTYNDRGTLSRRDVYVIIGCNYRFGEYFCGGAKTSTWSDNFLGAVKTDTAEQREILRFYDKAL